MPTTRLILGCGYLGRRVARRWLDAGDVVHVVTRSGEHATRFEADGMRPRVADVTDPDSLRDLPEADTVLYSVGYDRNAKPGIFEVYEQGLRHVLNALPGGVRRVVYTSSTGVYGNADGAWVDETTPTDPQRDGGHASLGAERALAESRWTERGVVLRLAGLYGPGRLPYLDKLRRGEPIAAPREGWLNLIHVQDAATAVAVAADANRPPSIMNVCDGTPVVREDYYRKAARLLGAPQPSFVPPAPHSPRAARAAANRRVSNRLMLEHLGVHLSYPTYREGLAAIVEGEAY